MRVTFIGLGKMGGPMAANLRKAGVDLTVCDLDPRKMEPLAALGARAVSAPDRAVAEADVVMTSLPGPGQIRKVALGDKGILGAMHAQAVWADLSTNHPDVFSELRSVAARHGVELVDAPVTGGAEGAVAGTLVVLVGGEARAVERCRGLLEIIGGEVLHLGAYGSGYVAKISQVILCYLNSVALSEALMLGVKGGIPAGDMLSVIRKSTGGSYAADRYGPPILRGDYDPSFALGLAHKDLRLALDLADSLDIELPLSRQVEGTYARACTRYGADANHLIAVRLLEEHNDTPLRGRVPR